MAKTTKPSLQKKPASPKSRSTTTRKLKQPDYKSFRLIKRIKHPGPKLSSSFRLTKLAILHLFKYKKLFAGIIIIYLITTLILVRGFVFTGDLPAAKDAISELFSGATGQLVGSIAVLGILINSTNPTGQAAGVYQSVIVILFSLITIWALRQTHAGERISLKDAMYKSSYPLVPFLLVLLVVGIQMLPLIAGSFIYGATIASGLSGSFAEVLAWSSLIFLLVLWSIYMVTSSLFALYIVTLPDMTPIRALKSAKGLVQYRRWTVMRKVLFLPIAIVVIGLVILLPVIFLITPAAEIIFLLFSASILIVVQSYIYILYRELLA